MIKTIFAQETAEAAHQQWEQVTDALREKFPKLADMMGASREDVLAYRPGNLRQKVGLRQFG